MLPVTGQGSLDGGGDPGAHAGWVVARTISSAVNTCAARTSRSAAWLADLPLESSRPLTLASPTTTRPLMIAQMSISVELRPC